MESGRKGREEDPLVVLLLGDLLRLVKELANAELELVELVLGGDLLVVRRVLPRLDLQVDAELGPREPQQQPLT